MTGFNSKRNMAQDKLNDEADTLTIVYQRGFADGKISAQRKPLTEDLYNKLLEDLYNELLFAVGRKYPDETRHQTALRYIRQAEMFSVGPAKAARNIKEQP